MSALTAHTGSCAIPTPVWHELLYGCARLPRGERRERLESYLKDVVRLLYPMLPYDDAAAAWHAAERARLEDAGLPTPFVDGQIAAIAAVGGFTLVTKNRKHFARFRGLALEDWSATRRGK